MWNLEITRKDNTSDRHEDVLLEHARNPSHKYGGNERMLLARQQAAGEIIAALQFGRYGAEIEFSDTSLTLTGTGGRVDSAGFFHAGSYEERWSLEAVAKS